MDCGCYSTKLCKAEKGQVYLIGGISRAVGYGPWFVVQFSKSLSRHGFCICESFD